MRIGIGLPAAVPGTPATAVGAWAAESERMGFRSVSVIDRLVYDNLDPFVARAVAAECTDGRVTAGRALGGWPEDYAAGDVGLARRGAAFDAMLATMHRAWAGEIAEALEIRTEAIA